MQIRLPRALAYPVKVTELHVKRDSEVKDSEPLISYSYEATFTEDNDLGEEVEVTRAYPGTFKAPLKGKLVKWMIKVGTVIGSNDVVVAEIEEPCSHPMIYDNLCAVCGMDMTERNNDDIPEEVTVNPDHMNPEIRISPAEALRIEEEVKKRLLSEKKLSLVVDLDQTIIHATVDPTVGEWRDDPYNINHDAVKDVRAFQLMDEGSGGRGCWYYVKLRPGLQGFLDKISQLYECHIYTMGTRAYAVEIAKIIDPEKKIFGDRILSRDESGSMTSKNLHRLFPVDTKMVVIIDDRGDVWKWSENLIKVTPYDFFVGIGDINSSFLPRRQEFQIQAPPDVAPATDALIGGGGGDVAPAETIDGHNLLEEPKDGEQQPPTNTGEATDDATMVDAPGEPAADASANNNSNNLTTLEQLITMSGGDDPDVLKAQTTKQSEALHAQQIERPLAKRQEVLNAQDEAMEIADHRAINGDETPSEFGRRHNLLHDDDTELQSLDKALTDVHSAFFEEYERKLVATKGGRVAEVRGGGGKGHLKRPGQDSRPSAESRKSEYLQSVPDIKIIMNAMKRRVFDNSVIVFTGVIPIGVDVQTSDVAQLAKSFGGIVVEGISASVTHVVAARSRTAKVRQAATKFPHIKIVNPRWFFEGIRTWERQDEDPYIIHVHPDDKIASSPMMAPSSLGFDDLEDAIMLSSDEEEVEDFEESMRQTNLDSDELPDPGSAPPPSLQEIDWEDVNDEFAEFMGSEAEDLDDTDAGDDAGSDSDSVASDESEKKYRRQSIIGKRERSRTPPLDGDESATDDDEKKGVRKTAKKLKEPSSRLAKRQRTARDRASGLRNVMSSQGDGDAGLPSPTSSQIADESEGESDINDGDGQDKRESAVVITAPPDDQEDEDDSNIDLMAEMEKEFS